MFSSTNVSDLRHDKTTWLDAGANPEEARDIVSKYYKPAAFAGIPRDALLVPMPSTTGKNILPDALAERISKDFGQRVEQREVAIATAKGEAKNKRTFFDKESDPVGYEPNLDVLEELAGLPVFITEDVHNTGESWIAFARMLQENGVNVLGVATLVSTEQRATSPRDIERLSKKVAAHTGKGIDEVLPAMQSLFRGSFKQLFNKAEADISRSAEKAGRLFEIASSGRRAGAYANPLDTGAESQGGILGEGGVSQGTFGFSLGANPGAVVKEPLMVDDATGLPLNKDGTVTLYHGTTKAGAVEILKSKTLKSDAERRVYLTTDSSGKNTGYGDGTTVAVQVDPSVLELDDEFPDGRQDFTIDASKKVINVSAAFMPFENSATGGGAFSIGPAEVPDIMAGNALACITDPRRRTHVMSRMARDFEKIRQETERITALAGLKMSKRESRQEANAREDLAAEEKIGIIHERYGSLLADEDLVKIKSQPVHAYLSVPRANGTVDPFRGRFKSKAQAIKDSPNLFQLHRVGDLITKGQSKNKIVIV